MSVIELRSLTKRYGKARGVADLDLTIERGERYGFLGPNGAGKTTTIRCIMGTLVPSAGEIGVFGQPVSVRDSAYRARIGYVAGDVALYDKETGRWHIDFVAGLRGAKARSANELIERLEFDPTRRVHALSKGNRQKLALILALMHDPELLILDEPTSGLDPINQDTIFEIINERVDEGATLFLSSHILSEVEKACDRVGIIREGRLVADESMASLVAKRLRDVELKFRESIDQTRLTGIPGVTDVTALSDLEYSARVRSDGVEGLIHALATLPIADLSVEHASLEDIFMEYYHGAATPALTSAEAQGGGGER